MNFFSSIPPFLSISVNKILQFKNIVLENIENSMNPQAQSKLWLNNIYSTVHLINSSSQSSFLKGIASLTSHVIPFVAIFSILGKQFMIQSDFYNVLITLDSFMFYFKTDEHLFKPNYMILTYVLAIFASILLIFFIHSSISWQQEKKQTSHDILLIFQKNYVCFMGNTLNIFAIFISSFMLHTLLYSMMIEEYILSVICILDILLLLTILYLFEQLKSSQNYRRTNIFNSIGYRHDGLISLLKLILQSYICTCTHSSKESMLYLLLGLFILDLIELKTLISKIKYLNKVVEILWTTQLLVTAFVEISTIIKITSNLSFSISVLISTFTFSVLASLSIRRFKASTNLSMLLQQDVSNENEAAIFMFAWINLINNEKDIDEELLRSLIQCHYRKCELMDCHCKGYQFQDSVSKMINRKLYLEFIHSQLLRMTIKFPNSFLIESVYIYFGVGFMKSVFQVSHRFQKFCSHNKINHLSLQEKYVLFQMKLIIQQILRKININEKSSQVLRILQEQQVRQELANLLKGMNENKRKKYQYLSQERFQMTFVQKISEAITNDIRVFEHKWSIFRKKPNCHIKILELFFIYFDAIVFSKRESIYVKDIIENRLKSLSFLKGVTNQNINRHLSSKSTCVLESNLTMSKLGIICNVTQNCENIFKIKKSRMIGQNIHNLMADFISEAHKKMLEKWIENQSISGMFKGVLDILFVDRNGYCFNGKIQQKIKSIGLGIYAYSVIIKNSSEDLVVLNNRMEIKGIGESIQKQGLLSKNKLTTDFCLISNLQKNILMTLNKSASKKIKIKAQIPRKRKLLCQTIGTDNEFKECQTFVEEEEQTFECETLIKQYSIYQVSYFSIKFVEIKKKSLLKTALKESHDFAKQNSVSNCKGTEATIYTQDIELQIDIYQHQESVDPVQKILVQNNQSSSLQSLINSSVSLDQMREIMRQKIIKIQNNGDQMHRSISKIILSCFIFVFLLFIIEIFLFRSGMTSFSNVLAADGAVNDNNEILEILYNRLLMTQVYCPSDQISDIKRCEHLLNFSTDIMNYLQGLIVDDIQVFVTNKTELTKIPFYSAYEKKVALKIDQTISFISGRDFISYFYSALRKIHQKTESNSSNEEIRTTIRFLFENWETLKQINHDSVTFYSNTGSNQLQRLQIYILIFSISIFILIFIPLVCLKIFHEYFVSKKNNFGKIYEMVSKYLCQQIILICQQVHQILQQQKFEQEKSRNRGKKSKKPLIKTILSKNLSFFNIFHIVYIVSLLGFCVWSLYVMLNLFPLASNMVLDMNELIYTENDAIQSLVDVKHLYMNLTQWKDNGDNLLDRLQQSEPKFIFFAKRQIDIFSQYDSLFQADFNKILIDDVCELTKDRLQNQKYMNCTQNMHYTILQKGLIAGITKFHRTTFSALLDFNQNKNPQQILKSKNIEDLDDYIIFMLKLFQETQNRMFIGLSVTIKYIFNILILILILTGVLMMIGEVWLLYTARDIKKRLSNMYGEALQLPIQLFRDNKKTLSILKKELAFQN